VLDSEVRARALDVAEKMRCRIDCEVAEGIGGVRKASAAAALIKLDDPVTRRIEKRAVLGELPDPGAPCSNRTCFPCAFPDNIQQMLLPSPTSSMPCP
jgi:hypothetical protein